MSLSQELRTDWCAHRHEPYYQTRGQACGCLFCRAADALDAQEAEIARLRSTVHQVNQAVKPNPRPDVRPLGYIGGVGWVAQEP
jgi:hypothetical protein